MEIEHIDSFETWEDIRKAGKEAREISIKFARKHKLWNYPGITAHVFFKGKENGTVDLDGINLKTGEVYITIYNELTVDWEKVNLRKFFKKKYDAVEKEGEQ